MNTWKPYFIWNRKNSQSMGIEVLNVPPIISPAPRIDTVKAPGRNGELHISDGSYEMVQKTVDIALLTASVDRVFNWLQGSGEIIFSNEPGRKQEGIVTGKIVLERVLRSMVKGQVQFDVQPFKYEIDQRSIPMLRPGTLNNIGTVYAEPIITIYAQGDLTVTINGRSFSLYGITDYITIDSRMVCAYRKKSGSLQDMELMNHHMSGEFPYFDVGKNDIKWAAAPGGRVDRLEITPFWRWL